MDNKLKEKKKKKKNARRKLECTVNFASLIKYERPICCLHTADSGMYEN